MAAVDQDLLDREPPSLLGQKVGAFRIGERLGGGTHSSVYRAINEETGETVALKVLSPGADRIARQRFRHEARTALTLDHPHVVRTLSVERVADDGLAYIALELIEGFSLADLLDRYRQLSVLDACTVLGPIAAALDYAHRQGIIHRDVKPSNILLQRVPADTHGAVRLSMLDDPVVPLLTDFGIARALDAPELTNAGRTIGTPAYMAPEQCEGDREIDGRADIYALGAVLYRCLVGHPPYTGSTTQILHAHVYSPLTIPDEVLVELPVNVVGILKRSLAKRPQDRYATASEMAADLGQITGRYAAVSRATGVSAEEATRTMTSLPATRPNTDAYSVLVPGIGHKQSESNEQVRTSRTLQAVRPATSDERSISIPWLAMGIVAAATVVVIAFGFLLRIEPARPDPALPIGNATVDRPDDVVGSPPEIDDGGLEANADEGDANGTLAPVQPPSIDVPSWWNEALSFSAERDWLGALDALTLVLRTDPDFNRLQPEGVEDEAELIRNLLLADPTRPFWSNVGDFIDPTLLAAVLFDVYEGLGTNANRENRQALAAQYFRAALVINPEAVEVADLLQATTGFNNASIQNRLAMRETLQAAHIAYADRLEEDGRYCNAAEQLGAATGLISEPELVTRLTETERRCATLLTTPEDQVVTEALSGRLLYSSEDEGRDRIFVAEALPGAVSVLAVEDGVLANLSPQTSRLAFYSTRIGEQGLFGFDLGDGQSPISRIIRFTRFAEDGRESPASWSPRGDQLTFASRREGDKQSRIYVTWADGEDSTTNIGFGDDPAWHPSLERIAYSGVDDSGNRPGLRVVASTGGPSEQLTDVEGDARPQWSPGGQYLVFTSEDRHGNWEIYRLDLNDRSILRMTTDPAQDVLPAVSPDGQTVAFLSDRSGTWAVWAMPLDGGDPTVLFSIRGGIQNWFDHGLQWIP